MDAISKIDPAIPTPNQAPVSLIEPTTGWVSLQLKELWRYRELLYFLTWRDVKIRYKQTVIGAAWAIIQPFMTMVVFSIFFGRLAGISSDGIPYPLFSFAALVPWTFFSNGLTLASNSLVGNSQLIKKVYFPRLVVPISSVSAGLVDFALAFIVLLGMMLFYGILPTANVIWLPAFMVLAFAASLGVSLWLSAMNVLYRDVRYVVPFLTQFWLFITPVAYPSSYIKNDILRALYGLNPMAGVVEGFRWALLSGANPQVAQGGLGAFHPVRFHWILEGQLPPQLIIIIMSCIATAILLLSGAYYFRRMERTFADVA